MLIGIDLGTTKSTCIVIDDASGQIVASAATPTKGRHKTPDHPGRSEWDAQAVVAGGIDCLKRISELLGDQVSKLTAIGITGQQHGTVIVDADLHPLSPFINWQDQRGNELSAGGDVTWVDVARARLEDETVRRNGCQLHTGFLGTTVFWLAKNDQLPANGLACFIPELFGAWLTGTRPVTEPTCAGGAGVFDVVDRCWSDDSIAALDLNRSLFPDVVEADTRLGELTNSIANATGLPQGIPVYAAVGDHQASFVGSVADRHSTILLNVGTGAQVAVFTSKNDFAFPIELRPFPIAGNLLSNVGLPGGWQFQVFANFIQEIGEQLFDVRVEGPLYERLTGLAAAAAAGADGLICVPTFSGTRARPDQTGSLTGMTPQSLTLANLSRSVLEGMVQEFRKAWQQIAEVIGNEDRSSLVGAGNGLRENALLSQIVADDFGISPRVTAHREEAAFGAALIAGVGTGRFADLDEAGSLIRYEG